MFKNKLWNYISFRRHNSINANKKLMSVMVRSDLKENEPYMPYKYLKINDEIVYGINLVCK